MYVLDSMRTRSAALGLVPALFAFVACGSADRVQNAPVDVPDAAAPPAADAAVTPEPDAATGFCQDAAGVYNAVPEASNVLFLIDRSGSMQIKLSDNSTRWSSTKKGLFDLLGALSGTGVRAGAMMFPQGDSPITCCGIDVALNDVKCNCAPGQEPDPTLRCAEKTYKVPIAVSNLDATHTSDIEAYVSTSDKSFYWGTPLATALQSAINAQKASPNDGTRSVVLLTDGIPTSCDTVANPGANDIQNVVAAATAGASGKQLVRTFVLGVIDGTKGARADYLSPIAKAGGTARAAGCEKTNDCFYPINAQTFATDLKTALDSVALQAFDCTFNLPPAQGGAQNDLSKVNVQVTSKNGTQALSRDTTHLSGWDYLPNQTQVQVYGASCQALRDDASAKVQIVVGCKTQGS